MRRMSIGFAIATVALGAAPILSSPASAQQGQCPYPVNNPRISFTQARDVIRRGQRQDGGGYVTRNGCGLAGVRVGLFCRQRPGAYTYVGQTLTGSRGQFEHDRAPQRTEDCLTIFSGNDDYGRAVSAMDHTSVTG